VKRALLVVALAGCDNVLGLTTVAGIDAPPPDGPTQLVSGDYIIYSLRNDASFAPQMVMTPVSASDVSLTVVLPDGANVPVAIGDGGAVQFQTPIGGPYELDVQRSIDSVPSIVRTSVQTFALRAYEPDRPGAVPAQQSTLLAFSVTNSVTSPAAYAVIASTGIRTFQAPESGDVDHPALDWAHSGRGLPDASQFDELFYERWQKVKTGYTQITDYLASSTTLVDGQQSVIGGPTNMLFPNLCVHVVSQRPTDSNVLRAHSLGTAFGDGWSISSVPMPALGGTGTLPIVQSSPGTAADDLDVLFGTPFVRDLGMMASVGISASRLLKLPTSTIAFTATDALAYSILFTPSVAGSCPTNMVQPDTTPIALLSSASIAGTVLAADGQQVTIDRSGPVPFAYTLTSNDYDDVIVTLFELVNVGVAPTTQTSVIAVRPYYAASPIAIDPSLLSKSHTYVLTVTARVGFPGARQLDYRNPVFPVAASRIWTAMFQIAN
jgi:hypothetical protein